MAPGANIDKLYSFRNRCRLGVCLPNSFDNVPISGANVSEKKFQERKKNKVPRETTREKSAADSLGNLSMTNTGGACF